MSSRRLLPVLGLLLALLGGGLWWWLHREPPLSASVDGAEIPAAQVDRYARISGDRAGAYAYLIQQRWLIGEVRRQGLDLPRDWVGDVYRRSLRGAPRGLRRSDLWAEAQEKVAGTQLERYFNPVAPPPRPQRVQKEAKLLVQDQTRPQGWDVTSLWVHGERRRRQVARALVRGEDLQLLARRFSGDYSAAVRGGVTRDVRRGQFPDPIFRVVQRARPGRIYGPIWAKGVWTWVRVDLVRPAQNPTEQQLLPELRAQMRTRDGALLHDRRGRQWRQRWRGKTRCSSSLRRRLPELCARR